MSVKNSNQQIQSLWIGGNLSKVERLCIQSFLDHGHDFHLYAYDYIDNVPKGTTLHDARTTLAKEKIFRFKDGWGKGSVAGFADIFRLKLIHKHGGWWVDMDTVCLKKFDFDQDIVFCSTYENEYGSLINNSVFKLPKNSPFIESCLSEINKSEWEDMEFGQAGPFLFQRKVKEFGLEKYAVPYEYFNPIGWRSMAEVVLGKLSILGKMKEMIRPLLKPNTMLGRSVKSSSYTVHLWNEVWSQNGFDKNGTYSKNSLFEKLKRKHNIV